MTKKLCYLGLFFVVLFNLTGSSQARFAPHSSPTSLALSAFANDITYRSNDLAMPAAVADTTGDTTFPTTATGMIALQSYALSVNLSQVAPGGQLTVTWSAPSGRPTTDWVALYKVGDPNTSYGAWQYTNGTTSGSFTATTPTQAGQYEFRYLLQGGYTEGARSSVVPVTLTPMVSISSPTNNAAFAALSNISITATASDSDGTISKVEFFEGSTKLGESLSSPYSYTWNSAAVGSYVLTAKATDNFGGVTTSTAMNISVFAPGTLAGKITKSGATTAIAGATVNIYLGSSLVGTGTSNGTGDYTISGLDAGAYIVEVVATGYTSARQSGVSVTNGATTTVNLSLTVPINYAYDSLGRLIAVMDQGGNTATYSYDAVGNLLSINRQNSTQVSILGFSPGSGPTSSSVTLYGTGFSETASQNSVSFNGTAATVVSSSATQIVTTVPVGATTGTLAITTPSGSATSSASFTVTTEPGAPTISGFTPAIGTTGTAVTINGANFETIATNNRTTFNISDVAVSSATATSLSATTPSGGSGRVSVATARGTAVSSSDFFIPPSPYTAANVNFTGRMSIGGSGTVTINTAGKIGMMLFDGVAGQRIGLTLGSATFSYNVTLYNPDGSIYYGSIYPTTTFGSVGGFLDFYTMPATGTYTILITNISNTGSVPLTLSDVTDVSGAISANGSPVTIATNIVGQNAKLTFAGIAGQRSSLKVTSTVSSLWVSVLRPDGAALESQLFTGPNGAFFDLMTLPVTGAYTIYVNPSNVNTGSTTLTLYDVPADITTTIIPGGSPVTVTTTVPGQNAIATFSGTMDQKVSLNLTAVSVTNGIVYIKKSDGTILAQTSVGTSGAFLDTVTLPANETYTILVNPTWSYTGSMTLTLYVVTDSTGAITPGGSAVTVTTTVPGQNGWLEFSGTAGQRISLHSTGKTFPEVAVEIKKPDGSLLYSQYINNGANSAFIDATLLPTTGTYKILVNPYYQYTGSITLTLYDVTDVSGTITMGTPITATTTTPGQNVQYTFSGTSGQKVSLNLTGVSFSQCSVYIKKPDGTNLTSTVISTGGYFSEPLSLPTTGTYTILLDPYTTYTGNITVGLYEVVDVTGTLIIGDPAITSTITTPGQRALYTFSGAASQQVTVQVTSNTITGVWVRILKPDGSTLYQTSSTASSFNLATQTLPTTGTYTVVIDPETTKTGSLNVNLTSP
jgi:YD repeat-containing protein